MLFSRQLVIESPLSVNATRQHVRTFATSRDMPTLEAFRRQVIIGWRLSEANEDFLFQPEYGDALNVGGARFVGLVEAAPSGSRIRGNVVLSPLMRIVMGTVMLAVVFAAIATLRQATEPAAKVLSMASVMLGAALLMVQYSLRSTSRIVDARLRQCLEAAGPRIAA
jgi:hypothetical protein